MFHFVIVLLGKCDHWSVARCFMYFLSPYWELLFEMKCWSFSSITAQWMRYRVSLCFAPTETLVVFTLPIVSKTLRGPRYRFSTFHTICPSGRCIESKPFDNTCDPKVWSRCFRGLKQQFAHRISSLRRFIHSGQLFQLNIIWKYKTN